MNKNLFKKVVCLVIAFMMMMPAMPGVEAFGAPPVVETPRTINADAIFDYYDASTNNHTALGAFWFDGGNLYLGFTVMHNNTVTEVTYSGTATSLAIEHLENGLDVKIVDRNTSHTEPFSVDKSHRFVIVNLGKITLGSDFTIAVKDTLGVGHEIKDLELNHQIAKIIKLSQNNVPLSGSGFSINESNTIFASQGENSNELNFTANPGAEFLISEKTVPNGYIGVGDFTVKVNSAGTGFEVVDDLPEGVYINGFTINVVNKVKPVLAVQADDVEVPYDGILHGVSATSNLEGAVIKYWNEITSAYDLNTSPTIKNVSDSVLTVKFQATLEGYNTAEGQATVKIIPRPVTIDAKSAAKVFGMTDPVFTGTVSGLVDLNDLGTITYFRTNSDEKVGAYEEVIDALYKTNDNYTVTVNKGKFTITENNNLVVSGANVSVMYNGNPYGVVATSNVEGATIKYWNVKTSAYDLNISPTIMNVSDSVLTVKFQATLEGYNTAEGQATVTINPKPVTIDVVDAIKVFGMTDPVFTGTVSGLVDLNDLGAITYFRTNSDEKVGAYEEVIDALYKTNDNYTVTVNKGKFTITENNKLTVSAANVSVMYNGNSYGVVATSNVEGATIKYWNDKTSAYDLNISPTIKNVSDSVLTVKFQATLEGYNIAEGQATVTINPKPVTIDVADAFKVFGMADPIFTGTVSDLVSPNDLGTITYFRTNSDEEVETYEEVISASYTQNSNYIVLLTNGDFTITNDDISDETVNVWVTKEWIDGSEQEMYAISQSQRPSSITVHLVDKYDDGKVVATIQIEPDEYGNWYGYFEMAKNDGEAEINYYSPQFTVVEDPLENYDAKVNIIPDEGFVITNTYKEPAEEPGLYYIKINHYTKTGNAEYVLYSKLDIRQNSVTTGSSIRVYGSELTLKEILDSGFVYQSSSPEYVDISAQVTSESAIRTYEFDLKYYKNVYDDDDDDDDDDDEDIPDPQVPLADLEKLDHFAYVIGYPEGDVRPLNNITREEVAMIFYRLLTDESRNNLLSDSNPFTDLENHGWSNRAISTLYNAGIIKGYPDGTFKPSDPISRAEFATIAAKFDKLELGSTSKFTDIFGHWAEKYITSSEIKGWIKGYPDLTFKPEQDITRAEAMTLINNVLERLVPEENIHPDAMFWPDSTSDKWYFEAVMEATNSHNYIYEEDGDELWTGLKANKVWP